jgi:hypothetical protein
MRYSIVLAAFEASGSILLTRTVSDNCHKAAKSLPLRNRKLESSVGKIAGFK